MFGISESISETFKQIIQSLQIRFIFPSALFIIVTIILFDFKLGIDSVNKLVIVVMMIIILSYLLSAFNGLITRLAEGYQCRNIWLFKLTDLYEKYKYKKIKNKIDECKNKINRINELLEAEYSEYKGTVSDIIIIKLEELNDKWEYIRSRLEDELSSRFPPNEQQRLPTALGNTIAAFENYPKIRYEMDAVVLWPRLLPIIEEKRFMPFILREKITLDFLLNTVLVCTFIIFELLFLFSKESKLVYLISSGTLLIFSFFLYCGAISVAKDLGLIVSTAFDLYRNELRESLYLKNFSDNDLESERQTWRSISQFIKYAKTTTFEGFVYSEPSKEKER